MPYQYRFIFCSFLHCSDDDKKTGNQAGQKHGLYEMGESKIQQYFVKQEMYEDAARMKKVIDEELKEIERFMKDKDYS